MLFCAHSAFHVPVRRACCPAQECATVGVRAVWGAVWGAQRARLRGRDAAAAWRAAARSALPLWTVQRAVRVTDEKPGRQQAELKLGRKLLACRVRRTTKYADVSL